MGVVVVVMARALAGRRLADEVVVLRIRYSVQALCAPSLMDRGTSRVFSRLFRDR